MESVARILLLMLFAAVLLALASGGPQGAGGWSGLKYWLNQKFALKLKVK